MGAKQVAAVLALFALLFAGRASAREHRYEDLYTWAQGVQWVATQPDRKYVEAFIQVRSHDKAVPVERITLLIHARRGDIAVPVSAGGVLVLPIDGDLIAENPRIEFTARVGVAVSVRVSAPPSRVFDYRLLQDMVAEYYRLVGRQNFLPAQFKSAHVRGLALAGTDGLTAGSSCGLVPRRRDAALVIPYDEHLPGDCRIELSRMPASIHIASQPKLGSRVGSPAISGLALASPALIASSLSGRMSALPATTPPTSTR